VCGGELYQRDDDSEETVRTRLEVGSEEPQVAEFLVHLGAGPRRVLKGADERRNRLAARGRTGR
ncbi:hypothetical protein ABZT00_38775, partial [Streptomyces sp. NPDC005486]